ncbi:hypothetical protein NL532_10175 [Mesorhizobium sp. C120A]|uniref:hypothetical protein n=1 Tax=unclassified Mesorhizobium TaxID=325217 RepID=UPI00041134E1|nr:MULTISPECIES: hypothetical protein [unclassified Mesorhizobium]WJI46961.1 hypothetical protein NL532_10175 [Mesorhizobium sp. C120A]
MTELADLKAVYQAVQDAWSMVVALPEGKNYRELRRKAWEAKVRYHAAWCASLRTNESLRNEESVQG